MASLHQPMKGSFNAIHGLHSAVMNLKRTPSHMSHSTLCSCNTTWTEHILNWQTTTARHLENYVMHVNHNVAGTLLAIVWQQLAYKMSKIRVRPGGGIIRDPRGSSSFSSLDKLRNE